MDGMLADEAGMTFQLYVHPAFTLDTTTSHTRCHTS